ncbi:MAG: hypothetical protein WKF30_11280 [Pyrinomonadaceae bacterium]
MKALHARRRVSAYVRDYRQAGPIVASASAKIFNDKLALLTLMRICTHAGLGSWAKRAGSEGRMARLTKREVVVAGLTAATSAGTTKALF